MLRGGAERCRGSRVESRDPLPGFAVFPPKERSGGETRSAAVAPYPSSLSARPLRRLVGVVGGCCLHALRVDPVLEVLSRDAPLPPELHSGESARSELARDHEGRDVHVLTDVGDGQPVLLEVDGDAFHGPISNCFDALSPDFARNDLRWISRHQYRGSTNRDQPGCSAWVVRGLECGGADPGG